MYIDEGLNWFIVIFWVMSFFVLGRLKGFEGIYLLIGEEVGEDLEVGVDVVGMDIVFMWLFVRYVFFCCRDVGDFVGW